MRPPGRPADGCVALLKVAETGLTAGFHDREGFTTENDIKVFAIMKSCQECEVSGVQGAVVTVKAAAGRRLFYEDAGCTGCSGGGAGGGAVVTVAMWRWDGQDRRVVT